MKRGHELGLAHIEIGQQIGAGASGMVYRAYDRRLDSVVAVKVLEAVAGERARDRFDRECWIYGPLSNHPHVVTIHSAGYTADGSPYLEMELIEGGTLQDKIDAGKIPWQQAVEWAIPVCDAVQAAHSHRVLHRDIKPANILMSGDDPKLSDFGIAGLTSAACRGRCASWLHAAPEAVGRAADCRSDLYSLASTLFTMVVGYAPFELPPAETVEALLARIAVEPVPHLPPELAPPWLDHLIQRALSKEPDERPRSVAQLRAALEAGRGDAGQAARRGDATASDGTRHPPATDPQPLLAPSAEAWPRILLAGRPAVETRRRRWSRRAGAAGGALLCLLAVVAALNSVVGGEMVDEPEEHTFTPITIGDGVSVTRRWRLSAAGTSLDAELVISNRGTETFSGDHYEVLPRSVASDVPEVRFAPDPDEIVERDPVVVRFAVASLGPGQRLSATYQADLAATGNPDGRLAALAADQQLAEVAFLASIDLDIGPAWPAGGEIVASPTASQQPPDAGGGGSAGGAATSGQLGLSSDPGGADHPVPELTVHDIAIASTSATISFATSTCTTARLTGDGLGHEFPGWPGDRSRCQTTYRHTITGLEPATGYRFDIEVRDPQGPHRVVQVVTFATAPPQPPSGAGP